MSGPDAQADAKTALRMSALRARRALDAGERRRAAAEATRRLLSLTEVRGARTMLLYAALADELDLSAALPGLVERGVRTLFPRVRGDHLELVEARDLLTLTLGHRGVHEPAGPAISPEVLDVAVVPGVAFDVHGGRLGHGGGHYDRLLSMLPAGSVAIGTCFACQVVPRVPLLDHDQPVDIVVTENAVHRRLDP